MRWGPWICYYGGGSWDETGRCSRAGGVVDMADLGAVGPREATATEHRRGWGDAGGGGGFWGCGSESIAWLLCRQWAPSRLPVFLFLLLSLLASGLRYPVSLSVGHHHRPIGVPVGPRSLQRNTRVLGLVIGRPSYPLQNSSSDPVSRLSCMPCAVQ